jgi:hypothetical protein
MDVGTTRVLARHTELDQNNAFHRLCEILRYILGALVTHMAVPLHITKGNEPNRRRRVLLINLTTLQKESKDNTHCTANRICIAPS